VLPDGRLLVFEANATMLVHPEQEGCFAYRNPAVADIQAAFEDLLDGKSRGGAGQALTFVTSNPAARL
jgi:hypothetical protein